jgi:sulfite exporter TauE/SafE
MLDPGPVLMQHNSALAAPQLAATLVAVFMLGLGGATHCIGMCGGIATALARPPGPSGRQSMVVRLQIEPGDRSPAGPTPSNTLAYHVGRIASYSTAGALAGAVGSAAWLTAHLLPLQQIAFVIASLMLILIGLHLAGVPVLLLWLERVGAKAWAHIEPWAIASLKQPGQRGALLAGAAWGWVPCGMVYGALSAALVSGSALTGATIALVFGLGTLPGLLAFGWLARNGLALKGRPGLLRVAGVLIVLWGLAGLLRIDPLERLHQVGEVCVTWLR